MQRIAADEQAGMGGGEMLIYPDLAARQFCSGLGGQLDGGDQAHGEEQCVAGMIPRFPEWGTDYHLLFAMVTVSTRFFP